MTIRLYYNDAYATRFQAKVIERFSQDGQSAIVLSQTLFYPSSGGQPHDQGFLNQAKVINVVVRDSDQAIIHILSDPLEADLVEGLIDWSRRFDHMQQHTGQHVLSQAFMRVAGTETESFHLGKETCTIDLAGEFISNDTVNRAELLANQIIWENRDVRVFELSHKKAKVMNLRKLPDINGNAVRLINIDDFDEVACGGTHVSTTGEIGQIKVLRFNRQRQKSRVEFLCGGRALFDYRQKNQLLHLLTREMTTASSELPGAIEHLRENVRDSKRQFKKLQARLIAMETENMLAGRNNVHGLNIIARVFEGRDSGELRMLANELTKVPETIVLIGSSGERLQLIFACSEDMPIDMRSLMKSVLPLLGVSSIGGTQRFAQAGGNRVTKNQINEVINKTQRQLAKQP